MSPLTFIISLWVSTTSIVLVILTLYRIEDKPDGLLVFGYSDGQLLIVALITLLCSSVMTVRYAMRLRRTGERLFRIALIWNAVPVFLLVAALETTLRLIATETPTETILLGEPLFPQSLKVVVDNYRIDSFLSYDRTLGWVVKPNLSTTDGLYYTSVDGIRTSKADTQFKEEASACRIALVGDSHTFGEELKFEATWGSLLQTHLPECQILNFGVGGYSVGQMYLRYLRDVRPWHPTVVLFALSSNTAGRTMGVYGLTRLFPGIPWAQPRFLLKNDEPTPINIPLPSLQEIVDAQWVSELPYIDYDWSFTPGRWEIRRWRYFYHSYLFRLYTTQYGIWRRQHNGDSREALHHALFRAFLQAVESDKSIPLILYLPDKADNKNLEKETPSLTVLRSSQVDHLDLRPCLNDIPHEDRFIPQGDHYSMRSSHAIAVCVGTRVSALFISVKQKIPEYSPPR